MLLALPLLLGVMPLASSFASSSSLLAATRLVRTPDNLHQAQKTFGDLNPNPISDWLWSRVYSWEEDPEAGESNWWKTELNPVNDESWWEAVTDENYIENSRQKMKLRKQYHDTIKNKKGVELPSDALVDDSSVILNALNSVDWWNQVQNTQEKYLRKAAALGLPPKYIAATKTKKDLTKLHDGTAEEEEGAGSLSRENFCV